MNGENCITLLWPEWGSIPIPSDLLTFNFIHFIPAFWAVFTCKGPGSGSALTAHGSLDLKQGIQIQMRKQFIANTDPCRKK
jgi:hypothetical protein